MKNDRAQPYTDALCVGDDINMVAVNGWLRRRDQRALERSFGRRGKQAAPPVLILGLRNTKSIPEP